MVSGPDPPRADDTFTVIADASKERDRIKLRHNEQTKLTATVLNNVATAFIVGGGVAPFIAPMASPFSGAQFVWSIAWIFVGILLHIFARLMLRNLQ